MEALGLTARDVYLVHDELTGQTWRWGQHAFVRLTHETRPTCSPWSATAPGARQPLAQARPGRVKMIGVPDTQVADQLIAYITGARWFAGKGRRVTRALPRCRGSTRSRLLADRARRAGRDRRGRVPRDEDPDAQRRSRPGRGVDPVSLSPPTRCRFRGTPPRSPRGEGPARVLSAPGLVSLRPAPDLHHGEIARTIHPDLGSVVAYDAAQDPEACTGCCARCCWSTLADRDSDHPVPPDRPEGLTPTSRHGCSRAAEQHLGDVGRRGDRQDVPPARARPQPGHQRARRAEQGRGLGRGRPVRLGRGRLAARGNDLRRGPRHGGGEAGGAGRRLGSGPGRAEPAADFATTRRALGSALAEIHTALREAFPPRGGSGAQVAR